MPTFRNRRPTLVAVGLMAMVLTLTGTGYAVGKLAEATSSESLVTEPVVKNIFFDRLEDDEVVKDLTRIGGITLTARCANYVVNNINGTKLEIYAKSEEAADGDMFNVSKSSTSNTATPDTNRVVLQPGVRNIVTAVEITGSPEFRRKLISVMFHKGKQVINVQIHGLASANGGSCRAVGTATMGTA